MSSASSYSHEANSQARRRSVSSTASDDEEEEELVEDDDSTDRSLEPTEKTAAPRNKNKKTLGRVKIKMAYIDNKIRRYTTFSKRKTGIMKKAYELATLTGTEVMLLVASETGHVYTYATAKLQPMITSEAGKALIQTCLAKDEPIVEPVVDIPATTTTLSNNDVIFIDENQRKKRVQAPVDPPSNDPRPIKRAKLKSADDSSSSSTKPKPPQTVSAHAFPSIPPPAAALAFALPCLMHSDPQPVIPSPLPSAYTIDLNAFKANGMNIIFAPSTTNASEPSAPSNRPLVLTLGNLPYPPT